MKPIIIELKENEKIDLSPGELRTASLKELIKYRDMLTTAIKYVDYRISMKEEFERR